MAASKAIQHHEAEANAFQRANLTCSSSWLVADRSALSQPFTPSTMDKFKFDEATQVCAFICLLDVADSEQKELATFLETQQAQMRVNGQIQTLTAQCWEK